MNPIRLQRAVGVTVRTVVTYLVSFSLLTGPVAARAGDPTPADWPTAKGMVERPATGQSREGEIIAEIPIGVGSDGEGKELPSQIGRDLIAAAQANQHIPAPSFGKNLVHSAKALPGQQAMFVTVMALSGLPTISAALVNDPLAWQRTLYDPWTAVGLAGFYTLMATQGYTEHALKSQFPGKRSNPYLFPSLGMAVGMGMSMYVSNILTDANVALCSKLMFGALELPRSMSDEETQAELKRRRAILFEKYGVDPSADPCDRAYEHLIIHQKLWEMAPQLASVVTTALVMAFGQKQVLDRIAASTLKAGVQNAGKVVLKWALEIVPMFAPGVGVPRMAITGLLKTKPFIAYAGTKVKEAIHLVTFIQIDHFINPYIVGSWKSIEDGVRITNLQSAIQTEADAQAGGGNWNTDQADFAPKELNADCVAEFNAEQLVKQANGAEPSSEDLTQTQKCWSMNHNLRRLGVKMVDWRKKVLSRQLTAYQTWEDFLQQFLALQNGTKAFYREFLKKKVEIEKGAPDIFKDSFSTFGVRRQDGAGKPSQDFFVNPAQFKADQLALIQSVGERFLAKRRDYFSLDISIISYALEHFKSGDPERISKGLQILSRVRAWNMDPRFALGIPELGVPKNAALSENLFSKGPSNAFYLNQDLVMHQLGLELGEYNPLPEPGRGAMYLIREFDDYRQTFNKMDRAIQGLVPIEKYNSFGAAGEYTSNNQKFAVTHIADKLLVQMACGTDPVQEKDIPLASWSEGWKAEFYPPSIINNVAEARKEMCAGRDRSDISKLYTQEFTIGGKKYKGIIEAIRGNLRADIDTPEKFETWWTANIDPKLEEIYKQYRFSYNKNVQLLHSMLIDQPGVGTSERVQSWFNLTEVPADSVLENLEQELKYNLAILGDIYAAALKKKLGGAELPASVYGLKREQDPENWCRDARCSRLAMFKKSNHLTLALPGNANVRSFANFQFQDEVLKAFGDLRSELLNVQWRDVDYKGKKVTMVKATPKASRLLELFNLFEVLVDEKISIPMRLSAALTSQDAALEARNKRIKASREKQATHVQIKNPVIATTAQIARDNVQSVLSELRNYATILTMASLKMGDAALDGN